jgi:hypothetical protein
VWLGTGAGLFVLTDWASESWVAYRRSGGSTTGFVTHTRSGRAVDSRAVDSTLPDNRIRCLAIQGDDIWVGTPRGLARGTARAAWRELPAAEDRPETAPPSPIAAQDEDTSVRIAILGPLARPITRPGAKSTGSANFVDRMSVGRAVDRANDRRETGKRPPFVLAQNLYTFASYGWGTPQDSFSILRDRHDARGFIGYIEPNARIDTAVALRTEVPVVNVATTGPTTDETINPWIFRCGSNDPRRHRLLLNHVFDSLDVARLVAVRAPGPETRIHLDRWSGHARARGRELVAEIDYDPRADDLAPLLAELRRVEADGVLTWSDARTSAALLRELRSAGWSGLFVGSDLIVNGEFIALAGADPGPVIAMGRCPHLRVADDVAAVNDGDRERRLGLSRRLTPPHGARSFEATMHLLAAIELGGSGREAIRNTLREMEAVTLARLENGAWTLSSLDHASRRRPR